MTLTVSPPTSRDHDSAEALIREAHRLHRRRQRQWAALLIVVLLAAAGLVTGLQDGGPVTPRLSPHTPSSPPAQRRVNGPSLGPATSYQLTGPMGVAVDRDENVYFSDGNRVLEVDHATGQLQVVAGTGAPGYSGDRGPGPRARLSSPTGVAVAPNGDVYFEDGNRIRKVSAATGIISTVAGNGRSGSNGNGGPAVRATLHLDTPGIYSVGGLNDGLAFGPRGDLYIADTANNEVQKVSLTTGVITRVTGVPVNCARDDGICAETVPPCEPIGVAVDSSSDVFVATACGSIREVSSTSGAISTIFSTHQAPALAGKGGALDPVGLAVLDDKKLLVTEAYGRRLLEIDLRDGKVGMVAGTGAQTLPAPHQTAGDGGPASEATFGLALGAAEDGQGDIYVADFFNNAIREIDARTGVISTVAGEIPTSPAQGHCC